MGEFYTSRSSGGTFTIADWATESETLARQKAYVRADGTAVQDNDLLEDAYFTPAIDAVKAQVKKSRSAASYAD